MKPFFLREGRLFFTRKRSRKVMRSGAEMIVEALRREGVDTVFGYPGGAVIPIFNALYDAPEIRVVLNRHEQAAVHAADGYARATGKVGVCLATSGPGATNTVTGLATARFDSIPLVCVTGQVARALIGNDAFQEADTVGITQPVTKHNYLVTKRSSLGSIMKQSFHLAASGRPGPIVVDVPKDLQMELLDDEYPDSFAIRGYKPAERPPLEELLLLAREISRARKPLFFLGGGMVIAGAREPFEKIFEATGIPVVTSLMGMGIVDSAHPLNLGMIGMHGSIAANKALTACDLLVGLGVRFDDRATGEVSRFAPKARIAHIDIDPTSIGRNVKVDLPLVGDLRLALEDLAPLLEPADLTAWAGEVESYRQYGLEFMADADKRAAAANVNFNAAGSAASLPPLPREILDAVNEIFPDAVISTEVGQNQMWAAQFLKFSRPRRWLTSGGLGTMGYGFPAALGAKAGMPDDAVVVIAGDGSFQMNIQELATCVQENLPVIVVILNNGYLGMVRQWQEMFYGKRYSHTDMSYAPDFVKLAEAFGIVGLRATKPAEVEAVLKQGLSINKPVLMDFRVSREECVYPMVHPGESISQMALGSREMIN